MTRIVCCQLAPRVGELQANLAAATAAVVDALASGARIIVLPELATSGYMFHDADEVRPCAIDPSHPAFAEWADLLRGTDAILVSGFAEVGDDGLVYNSAAVLDGRGVLAVYRKVHLWDHEKLVFTAGSDAPPVVDTAVGRIGVLICFDLEFPEMTRSLALRGAELICVPTNWPREKVPAGERVPEVTVAMAAAYSNRIGIACCDRRGTERGQDWNEASCVVDEHGWVIATADDQHVARAELDLAASHDKSMTPLTDLFADRHPELYGALSAPRVTP